MEPQSDEPLSPRENYKRLKQAQSEMIRSRNSGMRLFYLLIAVSAFNLAVTLTSPFHTALMMAIFLGLSGVMAVRLHRQLKFMDHMIIEAQMLLEELESDMVLLSRTPTRK